MGKDSKQLVPKEQAQRDLYKSMMVDILDEIEMARRNLELQQILAVMHELNQKGLPVMMTAMQIAGDDDLNTIAYEAMMAFGTDQLHDLAKKEE